MWNTTIDRFRGRIVAFYHYCNRTVRKEIRNEGAERRIETEREKFKKKALCQTLSKAFDMSKATAKVSLKHPKKDYQESVRKARRSPIERLDWKPYSR